VLKAANCILFVYGANHEGNFEKMKEMCEETMRFKCKRNTRDFGCVLCANKSDILTPRVATHRGMELARTWDMPFIEMSCVREENVNLAFEACFRDCWFRRERLVLGSKY